MVERVFNLLLALWTCFCARDRTSDISQKPSALKEGRPAHLLLRSQIRASQIAITGPKGQRKIIGLMNQPQLMGWPRWTARILRFQRIYSSAAQLVQRASSQIVGLMVEPQLTGYSGGLYSWHMDRVFIKTFTPQESTRTDRFNYHNYDNDIALVILGESVDFPSLDNVEPASLPTSDYDNEDYVNDIVLISGWGTIIPGNTAKPNTLQAAEVQIFSEDACKKSYGRRFSDNMICAGVETYTKDSCQGDSGGPLVLQEESTNTLLGITSWGSGCAQQGYPGVYTKVSNYISWIEDKACSSNACFVSHVKSNTNNTAIATTSGYLLPCALVSVTRES
ncbi:unnamed protein product, partial [Meganyctiphanes norvegica]